MLPAGSIVGALYHKL